METITVKKTNRMTKKAIAIYTEDKRFMWLPISQIVIKDIGDNKLEITLPQWLLTNNRVQYSTKQGGLK